MSRGDLSRDEAALILNKIHANRMHINPTAGTSGMVEYTALKGGGDADVTLFARAMDSFGLKAGCETSNGRTVTYQAPIRELDMEDLAKRVNFPGRDKFIKGKEEISR